MSHEQIAREMIATAESYVTRVVSKEDKIRIEAIRLVNKYHAKQLNIKEGKELLRQVIAFSITCNTIVKNIAHTNIAGQGVIPICNKIDGDKLNDVIDSCNAFVDANPQMGMHKNHKTGNYEHVKELKHIDLLSAGVIMYLNGVTLPTVQRVESIKSTVTVHDKKVIASNITHQLGDVL
jgi:hypothetical protein